MTKRIFTGLENLITKRELKNSIKGTVGYLCHEASVNTDYKHGAWILKEMFGNRLTKLFSPQHGIFGDAQDDMIESDHFIYEDIGLPVFSLYSETRKPTSDMLHDLDCLIIDLQDVGTRVYTYIYTTALVMEACAEKNVKVIILDRPNPIGGKDIEGNILDLNFKSFVGMYPIPMRHGLTIGEFAMMVHKYRNIDCDLQVIPMAGWERGMSFEDTQLPWILPSPNLPNIETAWIYPGSVLFEGTNLSEGRGTTKSLEMIGHPEIQPDSFLPLFNEAFQKFDLKGFSLRPLFFKPTFQKHKNILCGGYQIHVRDRKEFRPWKVGQVMCHVLYHTLGSHFQWKEPPFEYEYEKLPIDLLNGTDKLRDWVMSAGDPKELDVIEYAGRAEYLEFRSSVLLYP